MNRDALLASLIGFGIGLLITGILLVGPNLIKGFPQVHLPTLSLPVQKPPPTSPTPTPRQLSFAIGSPTSDSVSPTSDLLVSGTAHLGAMVVVAGPNDEDVAVVKDDGTFAGKITLSEGKNDITATEYLQGKPTAQTITVYFTKENW